MHIMLTLLEDYIAPRFDMATKILIAQAEKGVLVSRPKTVLLPGPSGDQLCSYILKEKIGVVVCGGIEEIHYQYLTWKKIQVIDQVIGTGDLVLQTIVSGMLHPGSIIRNDAALAGENRQ
jgi:hypothetical protein